MLMPGCTRRSTTRTSAPSHPYSAADSTHRRHERCSRASKNGAPCRKALATPCSRASALMRRPPQTSLSPTTTMRLRMRRTRCASAKFAVTRDGALAAPPPQPPPPTSAPPFADDDAALVALLGEAARCPRMNHRVAQAAANKLFPLAFIRVLQAYARRDSAENPADPASVPAVCPLAISMAR